MKKLTVLLALLFIGFLAKAQDKGKERQSIEKQIDAMLASWNRHNYDDMDNYITPDCDWVNIVGMWWKGSKEVKFAHQTYHDTMFQHTAWTKKQVKISLLDPTVAVVHLLSHIGSFTTPAGQVMPEADDLATLVFVKRNGQWLLRAGENVAIDPQAQPFNPALQMPH